MGDVQNPIHSDEIYCFSCGKVIKKEAEICPHCGVRQKKAVYEKAVCEMKNPGIAAIASALWVGLGQIYNGQIGKGIALMVAYLFSLVLIFLFIGFITTPLLWIYGVYDAYKTAEKINQS